jgi:hypothetical protein
MAEKWNTGRVPPVDPAESTSTVTPFTYPQQVERKWQSRTFNASLMQRLEQPV